MEKTQLFVDGTWRNGSGSPLEVENPSTGEIMGQVETATTTDLDECLIAAERAFSTWRKTSPLDRSNLLRAVAQKMRDQTDIIAPILTAEQGKPIGEARSECLVSADLLDWFAEEARRTYGRIVPSRLPNVMQSVIKEPIGVSVAFSPWNFPIAQAIRKIGGALGTGCTLILKGPEETPCALARVVELFRAAGLPAGVLQLVYGVPAEISSYLIPHPTVRKVSFTGSTSVGKHLAQMAGQHMKRTTMELGGHAPVIIFDDADVDEAAQLLSGAKHRNSGQICVAPTRFIVQDKVYSRFLDKYTEAAKGIRVGDGTDPTTTMGAMANSRRIDAMEDLVADAVNNGAQLITGGSRIGNRGYYFEPTILTDVPIGAKVMNEEPFGPISLISKFNEVEQALEEANRLPYGLAAYAYTRSSRNANLAYEGMESGMISVNHQGLALAEVPFGGVKESGYGSEGGVEAMEGYLVSKFVTHAHV